MRREKTERVSAIIKAFFNDEGLSGRIEALEVVMAWKEVIGGANAGYITSCHFDNGTLVCRLSSSMVRAALYYSRDELIRRVNVKMGKEILTRISLR